MGAMPPDHPPIGGDSTGMPASGAAMPGLTAPATEGTDLQWTAPADWAVKPGDAMRKAIYQRSAAGGVADITVSVLRSGGGGLAANLNRWRGQVGLAPLTEAELLTDATKLEANGLSLVVVDYAGGNKHLLGAIAPYQGFSWFFKVTGPDAAVTDAKPAFLAFLRTVKAP